jgi:hypothetical protein
VTRLLFLLVLPGLAFAQGTGDWEAQGFRGKAATTYSILKEPAGEVVQADCKASASGLIRKDKIDLARTPFLRWRWRIESTYRGINEREKAGDDYPARVYVVLDGGLLAWRTRSLVYVWSSTSPAGADWPNPYTAQAHMVALRSGNPGVWHEERRDVRADFKRYFGLDVDAIDGVALMTDCDDARGATRAWYADVRFE